MQQEDLQAIEKMLDRKFKDNNDSLREEIKESSQSLEKLLDRKFKDNNELLRKEIKEDMTLMKDDIIAEIGEVFNEAFTGLEGRIEVLEYKVDNIEDKVDKLSEDVEKRPTRDEMFSWADNRFIDLELAKERHDFLHIDELDKLPAPIEINKALIERGFKQRTGLKS